MSYSNFSYGYKRDAGTLKVKLESFLKCETKI